MAGGPIGTTRLDSGWNGSGHGQDIVHNYATSVSVNCVNPSPPCGSCAVDGPDPTGEQTAAFTRCKQDPTISCSNPFGIDPVCPGTQECTYYLGPPAPLSASNTPTCGLFRLENDISGTYDPDTGEAEQDIQLRAVIHTGIALNKPCPICVGDPIPEFFASKGFTNEPGRCPDCRAARKQQRGGNGYSSGSYRQQREMYPAVCASCGKNTQVPFEPRNGRPVYCSDCYSTTRR